MSREVTCIPFLLPNTAISTSVALLNRAAGLVCVPA
jgi:hypothetical protein